MESSRLIWSAALAWLLVFAAGCSRSSERPDPERSAEAPRAEQRPESAAAAPAAPKESSPPAAAPEQEPSAEPAEWFTEIAAASGLDFHHFNGVSGEFYLPEVMAAAGAALFDYDNDGDLDVYLVQSDMLGPGKTVADARFPPRMKPPLTDRLYRNDLTVNPDGSRTLRFTDVTVRSRIEAQARGYGMGVAAADYDNDGRVDLYVIRFGSNQMLRNNGDGTFTDVTAATGTDDPHWSVSAAFLDYDRDGWLDLFVGNYLDFTVEKNKPCLSKVRDYCGPKSYSPVPNRLFRNRGDGTFQDVSVSSRIASEYEGALGVVAADFDGDRWTDIYVANDGRPNLMWMNRRDGTFENTAMMAGSAVNQAGRAEASMGVDAGDFDSDGDDDLFMTHLAGETNTLYLNRSGGIFDDVSGRSGLGGPSLPFTGFGTAWFDYDNDGRLDLLVANGAVAAVEALVQKGDPYPFAQTNQLFRNLGSGRFEEVSGAAGKVFELSEVSRSAAFGDIDNDGDTDVLIGNNNGPVRLLRNNIGNRRHWTGLRMVGRTAARDMIGTRVAVLRDGSPALWRRARSDGSYGSANDPRVLIGLGDRPKISAIRAIWPSGREEEWPAVPAGRWTTLKEGSGRPVR